MDVEAVGAIPSPRRPVQPVGITAGLAEVRKQLREATPSGQWDAVLAEVNRLQYQQRMSPLAALQAVYAELAPRLGVADPLTCESAGGQTVSGTRRWARATSNSATSVICMPMCSVNSSRIACAWPLARLIVWRSS
jgi:hypothetical protein